MIWLSNDLKNNIKGHIDWLKEYRCTSSLEYGIRLPWDQKFFINSISESNISTAFSTISHLLQGNFSLLFFLLFYCTF